MKFDDLSLDRPTLEDVAAVHEIYNDPRVWTHFPSGRHREIATTEQMVRSWIGAWAQDRLSAWLVRERATGQLLGHAGCSVRRGTFWNLGYRLAYETHGRGIATRVSLEAVAQAQETRPDLPVVAYLLEHNRASDRVAQKVGLTVRYRGPDVGNPDPDAVRLVYADRPLSEAQLGVILGQPQPREPRS